MTYRAPGTVVGIRLGERVPTPSAEDPDASMPGAGPYHLVTIRLDRLWGGHEIVFPWGIVEPALGARVILTCEVET